MNDEQCHAIVAAILLAASKGYVGEIPDAVSDAQNLLAAVRAHRARDVLLGESRPKPPPAPPPKKYF